MGNAAENKQVFKYDEARVLVMEELRPWLQRVMRNRVMVESMHEKLRAIESVPSADLKKYLLAHFQAESAGTLKGWMDLQSNIKTEIVRIFQPLKRIKRFSLRSIQVLSEVFLKEYRTALNTIYRCEDFGWMTDSDLDYLVKVVTSIYLERWIEKDRGSRKTISAFSRLGYKNKTSYKKQGDDDKEKANKIYRAYEKYHELFIMRQVQAKEEHERTPIAPYKRKNMSKYDLITLSWCDAWTKGHLRPLELVLFRRHLINRKSKRDTNQNETFCDALMQYYDFLLEIDCCLTKTKTDPIKNVEYVANCILVQKIERVYRFQLITDIVRYCQQFELEPCDFNTAITAAYFRRYSEIGGLFFESINVLDQEGKRKNIRSNDPLGVLNYGTIIHKIAHTHDPDKVDAEVKKELMRRIALMDLLTIYRRSCLFSARNIWSTN